MVNAYQINLYNELIALTNDESKTFYCANFETDDGKIYKIFNYRLANYTEFLKPSGIECRGTMFEVDADDNPIRLASIAFEKFWNLNECPATMDLDLTTVDEIADKADGSFIQTYIHNGTLRLKSKGSVSSDQAIDAMNWLNQENNIDFANEIIGGERLGFTVMLEWVAPHNRIVLGYENPELRVLGIRSKVDGSYFSYTDVDADVFPEILKRWTKVINVEDPVSFIESIPSMQGIEGYVVRLSSGQRVKVKCDWYLALHHTKDSINSPRRLFEAVLEEATDDMRSLFYDDKMAIKLIDDMEKYVDDKFNHMVDEVETFYETNKHLDRKDYAIKGQKEMTRMYFSLAMNKYIGRNFDYKTFLKGKWKDLGLKDIEPNEDETE